MAESVLNLHSGGHLVTYEELQQIKVPEGTATWHPVQHSKVLDTVVECLKGAGYVIKDQRLAVARTGDARFFGTLDLATPLTADNSVALAVGIRNSFDKSFPLGFAAGSRVFVCSNLAFRSELLVKRKHSKHGQLRFGNAIAAAVKELSAFKEAETTRIERLMRLELTEDQALAFIVRAMERNVISAPVIPKVLAEWRSPKHDYGTGDKPTAWRLLQSFTTVLGKRAITCPAEYAGQTIRLNALMLPEAQEAPVAA